MQIKKVLLLRYCIDLRTLKCVHLVSKWQMVGLQICGRILTVAHLSRLNKVITGGKGGGGGGCQDAMAMDLLNLEGVTQSSYFSSIQKSLNQDRIAKDE